MNKIVLAFVLLFAIASPAFACSCVFPRGSHQDRVRREFKAADAVFSAYVHSIHHAGIDGRRTRMAKLRILQVWKGPLTPDSWIDIASDDESALIGCSHFAESEQALMVYAYGQNQRYGLANCSLTGSLDDATIDIPLLIELAKRQRWRHTR